MEKLLEFILVFTLVYLISYFIRIFKRKKNKETNPEITEILYLVKAYKINLKKHKMNVLLHLVSITNAFIMALTLVIVTLLNNIYYELLLAIVVLVPLIIGSYYLLGKYLKYKERKHV